MTLEEAEAAVGRTYQDGRPIPERARLVLVKETMKAANAVAEDAPVESGAGSIPLKKKLRVKYLFLEGHAKAQIARDVGMTAGSVGALIARNPAWEMEKLEREEKMRNALVSVDREKAEAEGTAEIIAEIGSKAAEAAIGALDLALTKIEDQDAQGLNYAASAAKTFNGLFRQSRGLDSEGNGNVGGEVPLVLLVGNFPLVRKEKPAEKTEEPVAVEALGAEPSGAEPAEGF